jgi:hypothetical protein
LVNMIIALFKPIIGLLKTEIIKFFEFNYIVQLYSNISLIT